MALLFLPIVAHVADKKVICSMCAYSEGNKHKQAFLISKAFCPPCMTYCIFITTYPFSSVLHSQANPSHKEYNSHAHETCFIQLTLPCANISSAAFSCTSLGFNHSVDSCLNMLYVSIKLVNLSSRSRIFLIKPNLNIS